MWAISKPEAPLRPVFTRSISLGWARPISGVLESKPRDAASSQAARGEGASFFGFRTTQMGRAHSEVRGQVYLVGLHPTQGQ